MVPRKTPSSLLLLPTSTPPSLLLTATTQPSLLLLIAHLRQRCAIGADSGVRQVLCKGLLVGKLRTELSGDVHIRCTSSGLQVPFLRDEAQHTSTNETQHTLTDEAQHRTTDEAQHTLTNETQYTLTNEAQHTLTNETQHRTTDEAQHRTTDEAQHTSTNETQNTLTNEAQHLLSVQMAAQAQVQGKAYVWRQDERAGGKGPAQVIPKRMSRSGTCR